MSTCTERLLLLAICLLPAGAACADEELYQKVAQSTVMVYQTRAPAAGSGDLGFGTGFVVDAKERLVVTARHVVEHLTGGLASNIEVIFPETRNGEIITEARHYRANRHKLAVRCKIVYESARQDLAILQAEKLPAGVKALELAVRTARPGQKVHLIGNSSDPLGAVLSYCNGNVRNAFLWESMGTRVVTSHIPANKGDSGGPIVNDQGQVVGFCAMSGKIDKRLDFDVMEIGICVSEIRRGLDVLRQPALARPAFQGEFKSGIHLVTLDKGVLYRITVKGDGFVPDLRIDNILHNPVKGAGRHAEFLFVPTETKVHRIKISPFPGRDIAAGLRPYSLTVDRADFAEPASAQEGKIKLNEHVKKFEAGKSYHIVVKGKGFEPDVQILDGQQTVMTQFNNGIRTQGQGFLEAIGLATTEYETTVRFVAGKTADYRIVVAVSPFSPAAAAPRDYTVAILEQKTLVSLKDQLSVKDPVYPKAGPSKVHTVKLESGKSYQIELLTTAFDSKLVLEDSAGKVLLHGFDAEGFNSRLFFRPTATNTYRVVVTSHRIDGSGPFFLTVSEVANAPASIPAIKGPK